ncbi:MAG TPA: NADH-quinone oxidoreductase subunit J, partial [Polyangiaceae bacterium]
GIAGLFLKLSAEFMAAIQLIVYAGAVVVLFVFVIMLLGPDATGVSQGLPKSRLSRTLAGIFTGVLFVGGGILTFTARPLVTLFQPAAPEHGSVELVGRQLFTQAVVPFELTTALLIVAVVGAIGVARSSHTERKRRSLGERGPTERLFHGPLHPRDATHPLKERA